MIEVERGKPIWSFGVMTGTSMDGVDIAMLRTDGEDIFEFGPSGSFDISDRASTVIADAIREVATTETDVLLNSELWPDVLVEADWKVRQQIHFAAQWFKYNHIEIGSPDVSGDNSKCWLADGYSATCSGVHGQTVSHRPDEGFTLQIGARLWSKPCMIGELAGRVSCAHDDPLAQETSFFSHTSTEVYDFRSDDMKAGGQGAPLAPFYHFALAKHIGATEPVVFLNIGGVANITWVDPRKELPEEPGALMAFDTGPGNALVNDWMFQNTKCLVMDVDGATASTGRIHRDRLKSNWGKDYLRKPGPKSLDRNDFHGVLGAMKGLSINDGAATLTAFTADCVAESLRHMPSPPTRWLVCGGGRHNHTMMHMLQDRLEAPVEPVEAVGLDGDMLEAQAFAYLAVRVLRGLPTSAPSTTGCSEPVCGGRINYPT